MVADTPLGEVIERLQQAYIDLTDTTYHEEADRLTGTPDFWEFFRVCKEVTPVILAALQAGQEYVEAWRASERDWWPDDDWSTARAVYETRLALLAAHGR